MICRQEAKQQSTISTLAADRLRSSTRRARRRRDCAVVDLSSLHDRPPPLRGVLAFRSWWQICQEQVRKITSEDILINGAIAFKIIPSRGMSRMAGQLNLFACCFIVTDRRCEKRPQYSQRSACD